MKCRAVRKSISRFLDGSLSDKGSNAVLAHIADCAECRYLLLQTRRSLLSLRHSSLREIPVPSGLSSRIQNACKQVEDDQKIMQTSTAPAIGSPAFAATCASLLVGAVMFYVLTTQVYMPSLDGDEAAPLRPATTVSALQTEVAATPDAEIAATTAPAFRMLAAATAPPSADAPATPSPKAVSAQPSQEAPGPGCASSSPATESSLPKARRAPYEFPIKRAPAAEDPEAAPEPTERPSFAFATMAAARPLTRVDVATLRPDETVVD